MSSVNHHNTGCRGTSMRSALLILPILSGVIWGVIEVFVRTLSNWGINRTTIILSRVFLVMMLVLILAAYCSLFRFRPRNIWLFLACTLSMFGLNVVYTASVNEVSLFLATVLLSMSPVFILAIARRYLVRG